MPLLWAWQGQRPRRAAAYAWCAGVAYHAILLSWTWWFGAVAIFPLVAVLSLYWAGVGASVGWLERAGLRSPWLTAAVWVLGEALVARWPVGGFSWGEVGYAWHDLPVARDLASVGGVPLVSFLTVAANGLLLDLAGARLRRRSAAPQRWKVPAAGMGALLVGGGLLPLATPVVTRTAELRFALLQGNDKNRDLTGKELEDRYLPESHLEIAGALEGRYDLVVFPESSLDEDPRDDPYLARRLAELARRLDTTVLANAVVDAPDGRALNLDLLYDPDGNLVGTYAKRHLVPYGEWVPLRRYLGFIDELQRIPRDFAPGKEPGLFDIEGLRIATVICFESAFGHQIRPLVRDGAEVIVLSTNNRSYRRSANSAQHVAIGQMRAAETGRPILHAAISGITAVIEAGGDVRSTTALFERTAVTGTIRGARGDTLYVRFGDWVVWGSLLAGLGAVLAAVARRRQGSVHLGADAGGREHEPQPMGERS